MTATTSKEKYRNHRTSTNNKRYATETELSKYVWKLDDSGKLINIKWSILRHATPRNAGKKRCYICIPNGRKTVYNTCRLKKYSLNYSRNRFNAGRFNRCLKENGSKLKHAR